MSFATAQMCPISQFVPSSHCTRDNYLDAYEDVSIQLLGGLSSDESSDIFTTNRGRKPIKWSDPFKQKTHFLLMLTVIPPDIYLVLSKLISWPTTVFPKAFLSKSFYLRNSCLQRPLKFTARATNSQIGNDQHCSLHFVIHATITIHGLQFEVLTLVSKIYGHVALVIGIKNLFELEQNINTRDYSINFLT